MTEHPDTAIKKRKAPCTTDPPASTDPQDDTAVSEQAFSCIKALCVGWACILMGVFTYAEIVYTKETFEDGEINRIMERLEQGHGEYVILLGRDGD